MSFLDLYQKDHAVSAQPKSNEARDLPAGFGDTFRTAWNDGALFGQSTAYLNARLASAADYATEIADKTGDQTLHAAMSTGGLAGLNKRLAVLQETHPDLGIQLLTDKELDRRGLERSTKAHTAAREMAGQEKSLAGKLGGMAGGLAGAATDPINIVALPVAPAEGIGLLATALRWGAITGVSQTAIEVAGGAYHERVQPGYFASNAPLVNIGEAALGGAVIGGGIKALGNLWTRAKTGQWPQSVRDAGNVIESEANVANTNVYPGTAGEVAHRTALQDSIENMVNGRPINVEKDITPSVLAGYNERLEPVMAARDKAIGAVAEAKAAREAAAVERTPQLPFIPLAKETDAKRAVGTMAEELQTLARSVGHEIPAEDTALVAEGLLRSKSETEALAILDEFMLRPRTLPETLPSATVMRRAARQEATTRDRATPEARSAMAEDLTPARAAELRAEPEVNDVMLRDLDRLRAAGPDREIDGELLKRQFIGPQGVQGDKAGEWVQQQVRAALAEGKQVFMVAEGKPREILSVGPLGLKDKDGNSWGTLPLLMQKPGERDFIQIRSKNADLQIPMGETIDAAGERVPVMRSVESVIAEADARELAAREIAACVGPQEVAG